MILTILVGLSSVIGLPDWGWQSPRSMSSHQAIGNPDRWGNGAYAQTNPPLIAQGSDERLFQALDLTPAQIREIRAIQQRYAPQLAQRRQALRQAHQELNRLMAAETPPEQIRAKFQQVQQLRQQQAATHFESLLAMRSVLTPSQRRKFADWMQERQGTPRGRGGRSMMNSR